MHDSEDRDNLTAHSGGTRLLVVAAVLPAIVGYAILYRQAFPVPYQDDYKAILGFAVAPPYEGHGFNFSGVLSAETFPRPI
jgi:hypothetical protein